MHIYYDIEIDDSFNIEHFSPRIREGLETLRDFLRQRFGVLEDEMELEWSLHFAHVLIIMPKKRGDIFMLGFPDFTPELTPKLNSCLSTEDYTYLNKIIADKFFQ